MTDVVGIPSPYSWDADFKYSQATRVGDLIFVSGQAAVGADGQVVGEGDFQAQAACVFDNLAKVLEAAGSSLAKVAKVTIFMTDTSHFGHILECRDRYFTAPYPADSTVEVTALALPGLMLEIEAIATI
ncbi:MAG: RidA family protein [Candidatus Nanopelagicales bacterium]